MKPNDTTAKDYTGSDHVSKNLHGTDYQINVLILYALTYLQKGVKFELRTEDETYGKFDDILLILEDRAEVIQVKHSRNPHGIYYLKDIASFAKDKEKDSKGGSKKVALFKYFDSWFKHKDEGDIDFVIYSNHKLSDTKQDSDMEEYLSSCWNPATHKFISTFTDNPNPPETGAKGKIIRGKNTTNEEHIKYNSDVVYAAIKQCSVVLNTEKSNGQDQYTEKEKNALIQRFLKAITLRFEQEHVDALAETLKQQLREHYNIQSDGLYYALYWKIKEWLKNFKKTSYSDETLKSLFEQLKVELVTVERLMGFTLFNLHHKIQDTIKERHLERPEARAILNNYMDAKTNQLLLISGKSGVGKSALMKRFIEKKGDFSKNNCILLLSAEQLNGEYLEALPNLNTSLIVIDGVEYSLRLNSEKMAQQFQEVVKKLCAQSKKLVLLCQSSEATTLENQLTGIVFKHLSLEPLKIDQIISHFPSLEKFTHYKAFQQVLTIPFYLNLLVAKQGVFKVDEDINEVQLKDQLIRLSLSSQQSKLDKAKLTTLKRIVYNHLQLSKPLQPLTSSAAQTGKALCDAKILALHDDVYVVCHDIYFDWAVEEIIQDKFELHLEIEGELSKFLDFPSIYHLTKWVQKSVNLLIPYLSNVEALTQQHLQILLTILREVDVNTIEAAQGQHLGTVLYAIWQAHSSESMAQLMLRYIQYIPKEFESELQQVIQLNSLYRSPAQQALINLMLSPFDCEPVCQYYPKMVFALLNTHLVSINEYQENFRYEGCSEYGYLIRKQHSYDSGHDRLLASPFNGPWIFLLQHHGLEAIQPIVQFINFICMGYLIKTQSNPSFQKEEPIQLVHLYPVDGGAISVYGNQTLWSLHRNHSNAPKLLLSALMALEWWLYTQCKDKEVILAAWDMIFTHSQTVATLSILASLATFAPGILGPKALTLLQARKFYKWDFIRRFNEPFYNRSSPSNLWLTLIPIGLNPKNLDLYRTKKELDDMPHRHQDLEQLTFNLQLIPALTSSVYAILDQHFAQLTSPISEEDRIWKLRLFSMDRRKHHFEPQGALIKCEVQLDDELKNHLEQQRLAKQVTEFIMAFHGVMRHFYEQGPESLSLFDIYSWINQVGLFDSTKLNAIEDKEAQLIELFQQMASRHIADETVIWMLANSGDMLALALIQHGQNAELQPWCIRRLCEAVARHYTTEDHGKIISIGAYENEALAAQALIRVFNQPMEQELLQLVKQHILISLTHPISQVLIYSAVAIKTHLSTEKHFIQQGILLLLKLMQAEKTKFDECIQSQSTSLSLESISLSLDRQTRENIIASPDTLTLGKVTQALFQLMQEKVFSHLHQAHIDFYCVLILASSDYTNPFHQAIFHGFINLLIDKKISFEYFHTPNSYHHETTRYLVVKYILNLPESSRDALFQRIQDNSKLFVDILSEMPAVIAIDKASINTYWQIINRWVDPKQSNSNLLTKVFGLHFKSFKDEIFDLSPAFYQDFFTQAFNHLKQSRIDAFDFYSLIQRLPWRNTPQITLILEEVYQLLQNHEKLLAYKNKTSLEVLINKFIDAGFVTTREHPVAKMVELLATHDPSKGDVKQKLIIKLQNIQPPSVQPIDEPSTQDDANPVNEQEPPRKKLKLNHFGLGIFRVKETTANSIETEPGCPALNQNHINTAAWYDELHIFRVWDAHAQKLGLKFWYQSDKAPEIINTLSTPTHSCNAGILTQENGRLYLRPDRLSGKSQSVSLCSSVDTLATSVGGYNALTSNLEIALTQIKSWNQINLKPPIQSHLIQFPYRVSGNHWCLGIIELNFSAPVSLQTVSIEVINPLATPETVLINDSVKQQLEEVIKWVFEQPNVNLQIKPLRQTHQQNDGSSCGVITAENGKAIIEGTNARLEKSYSSGTPELRAMHMQEVGDPTFIQRVQENRIHRVGSKQLPKNMAELQEKFNLFVDRLPELGDDLNTKFQHKDKAEWTANDFQNIRNALLQSHLTELRQQLFKNSQGEYQDNGFDILQELIEQYLNLPNSPSLQL